MLTSCHCTSYSFLLWDRLGSMFASHHTPPRCFVCVSFSTPIRIDFPPEVIRGETLFTNMIIDETTAQPNNNCDDVFVYITDTVEPGEHARGWHSAGGSATTERSSHATHNSDASRFRHFAECHFLNDFFLLFVWFFILPTIAAIVVYDSGRDLTWRLSHPAMFPDPNFAQSNILGQRFTLMDGIVGITFDPTIGVIYFQPLATDR